MAKLIRNIEDQQNSIGADGKALIEQDLRMKTTNLLSVSGGYISTERDELGNILLHEDPNNLGSNKQLINQYISVDVIRRDYDDDELQKVFDTDINELFKLPKTKSADELRAEMERLRKLLADAEAEIVVHVTSSIIGVEPGEPDKDEEPSEDKEEFTNLLGGYRMAPYTLKSTDFTDVLDDISVLNDMILNIQTAIWNTDTQRIEHLNSPEGMVKYQIILNNETKELTARVESMLANPEQFQGWYFDAENLGNTQNYVSIGNQNNIVTISLSGDREVNRGPKNVFTVAVAYKDETPPTVESNILTFQMEKLIVTEYGEFSGLRDEVTGKFRWTLTDIEGNVVNESDGIVNNPFIINVIPGQELNIIMTEIVSGIKSLGKWYTITDDNTWEEQLNVSGLINNTLTFTIPENIKGLILRYYPE